MTQPNMTDHYREEADRYFAVLNKIASYNLSAEECKRLSLEAIGDFKEAKQLKESA